jgi:citrate synthase
VARVAGWLAHVLEQREDNRIYRPKSLYVGKKDIPFVPIEKR